MISRILRYCSTLLSFFIKNNLKDLQKKHRVVSEELKKKIKELNSSKSSKLKTHKIFSKKVYDLVKENKTINFLRDTHIQNIFFIHNRFFIFNELRELRRDKDKWPLWKKLLVENSVGDPVRYFLYPKSSGNRIRQVYYLKKYFDYSKINLFQKKYILEVGGGYGCMAQIFKKINKNCTYVIFDTLEVNFLQYYYLQMNKIPVVINRIETGKVCLINSLMMIKKFNNIIKNDKSSLFIANWSISEMPTKLRNNILNKISNFCYLIISFQEKFENIDNMQFFLNYKKKIKKKLLTKIEKYKYYKKNFFNKCNHFYFFTRDK
jgi:hypothetical protein